MAIDVQTKPFHDADGRVEYSSTRLFTGLHEGLAFQVGSPLTQGS